MYDSRCVDRAYGLTSGFSYMSYGSPRFPSPCVLGKFDGILSYQGKDSNQIIYVVKELRTNLLGLSAIKSINLIARLGGGECEFFTEFSSLCVL